jgi:1,5-anhydro-D-fructose reductase (1,5-anhydro-D-mannitol-forming)
MALTVADCRRMIDACRENGVRLGVGFENRHHPAHIEMRRLVASGALGAIPLVTAQYSRWLKTSIGGWRADVALSGGGSLMGLAIHCFDIVRFILGSEPVEVVSMTDELAAGRAVDELVLGIVRFANGTFCHVVSGINVPRSRNDLVVYGEAGRATSSGALGMHLYGDLEIVTDTVTTRTTYPPSSTGTLERQIEAFHRNIAEGSEPNASGEDGLRMVQLTEAVRTSAKDGAAVKVDYAIEESATLTPCSADAKSASTARA